MPHAKVMSPMNAKTRNCRPGSASSQPIVTISPPTRGAKPRARADSDCENPLIIASCSGSTELFTSTFPRVKPRVPKQLIAARVRKSIGKTSCESTGGEPGVSATRRSTAHAGRRQKTGNSRKLAHASERLVPTRWVSGACSGREPNNPMEAADMRKPIWRMLSPTPPSLSGCLSSSGTARSYSTLTKQSSAYARHASIGPRFPRNDRRSAKVGARAPAEYGCAAAEPVGSPSAKYVVSSAASCTTTHTRHGSRYGAAAKMGHLAKSAG
mmetsp:Transcript_19032/g.49105  ORF Transcript_19032/g.49105 Transcript_19032/m.49105 type:complete len:269 (+) Transcript_19032:164-970(+)